MLEEVLSHWKKWNSTYPEIHSYLGEGLQLLYDQESFEATKIEHFHDISEWKNKYVMLQETAAFLAATCETNTSEDIKTKFEDITIKWNGKIISGYSFFPNTFKTCHTHISFLFFVISRANATHPRIHGNQ